MNTSDISAIVTGGASGLGEATARYLASKGARVTIFDLNETRGEEVADDIDGTFCLVDVTNDESVDKAFQRARSAHGQERVLVNCAGIGDAVKTVSRDRETGSARAHPMDKYERTIQINLIGTFRCISKSASGMFSLEPTAQGERGAIINTGSIAAEDGQIGQSAYAASKAGIAGMTLPIARDLAKEMIRINTILPGLFHTPLLAGLPQPAIDALGASVPFPPRLGQPEEFAKLAAHLIENSYFNGATIRLDGALRMAPK